MCDCARLEHTQRLVSGTMTLPSVCHVTYCRLNRTCVGPVGGRATRSTRARVRFVVVVVVVEVEHDEAPRRGALDEGLQH